MSSLEASITLEDVFAVVGAKRVPLAAELAGYLALEIADGTDAGSGEVDPKTVFISEEGSVALVRPKKDLIIGDAEASVRFLLTRLLDAGGSSTPALGQAARRKPGNGLPALVEELEAALIPVNRAAGRRALARLSREVKRVTQGVGRNASSVAPVPAAKAASSLSPPSPPEPVKPAPAPEPVRLARVELKRVEAPAPAPSAAPVPAPAAAPVPAPSAAPVPASAAAAPPPVEATVDEPKHDPFAPTPVAPKPKSTSIPPPPVKSASGPPPPPPQPQRPPGPPSALHVPTPPPFEPSPMPPPPRTPTPTPPPIPSPAPVVTSRKRNDDVDALLSSFEVSGGTDDKQLARDLKGIAGLSPTPPHPQAKSIADLADEVGQAPVKRLEAEGDSVEALLAMADASLPAPAVSANQGLPAVAKAGPPSPIFGGGGSGAAAAGAPAMLRQSQPALEDDKRPSSPPPPATAKAPEKKEVFRRTSPAETADPAVPTRRRSAADPPRAPKTSMVMLVLALVALAATTIGIYKYAPHVFVGHKPLPPPAPSALATPARAPQCKLTLQITDAPPRSEILLRVGSAPVDVDHMPVGARLELVATAEGHAPRRAVIAAESVWDKGPDGKPRIEVPIQLDPSKSKPGTVDPWPAAEPNSQVGGSGAPGTVHVVSNVRGAEIWLLAGLGPDAKMEQKCDGDVDVLIAGPPENPKDPKAQPVRKRLHVGDKEIAAAAPDSQGNKTVTVSASK
ncbi:MAG: hypothetical protein U0270_25730 [Labilithrix sp.]